MKMVLRAFALVLFLTTVGVWAGLGGSLGWSKTKVEVAGEPDPITGIAPIEWRAGFVPGVEFLALGIGGSVLIFAATLFVRITPKPDHHPNSP